MKKTNWMLIILLSLGSISFAQEKTEPQKEIHTLFENQKKENTYGGYGTPLFGVGQFSDQWDVMIGGKGGVILNRKIALGLIGISKTESTPVAKESTMYDQLEFSYGAGGIFFEYFVGLEKPIHLSFPINFMLGETSIKNDVENGDDLDIESSGLQVIEPGISIEFNMSRYFVPTFQLSYRKVFLNSAMDFVSAEDLSGLYLGLNFKFGKF